MKIFIADKREKGYNSPTDYHWCDDGDILMFGQFQLNNNPSDISMCGIKSRKFTTHIVIKDIDIDIFFYKELVKESIERSMETYIDENGNYEIDIGGLHHFNINDIVNELLEKANRFDDGQKVKCFNRTLKLVED